jgi:hypothetical protein
VNDHDTYRAVINLGYSGVRDGNEYNYLLNALAGAGWEYVETSAMAYKGPLPGILLGLELLARAVPKPGTVSAITRQAQRIGEVRGSPLGAMLRRLPPALAWLLNRPGFCITS